LIHGLLNFDTPKTVILNRVTQGCHEEVSEVTPNIELFLYYCFTAKSEMPIIFLIQKGHVNLKNYAPAQCLPTFFGARHPL
jgi:hypothetical protein